MNILPEPEAPEPQAIKLDDSMDCCLAGATIGLEADRFVYSVSKLIRFERTRLKVTTAEARESLAKDIMAVQREHGILAPVFLNDELLEPVEDEKPKIITPGNPGFRRPPGRIR